ncbi:MAG: PEP-utilizing enzyme [Patescibacteria group bacterium]
MKNETLAIRNDPSKWWFWGRWNQCVLSSALWHRSLHIPALKELGIKVQGDEKILHGNFYILKADYDAVEKTLGEQGVAWFQRWFDMYENKITHLDSYKGDFDGFLDALLDVRGLSCLIELADHWMVKELQQACAEKSLSYEDVLAAMQPQRKTLLTEFQEGLHTLGKGEETEFVKKWEWVGTHAFEGESLTRSRLDDVLAQLKNKKEVQNTIFEIRDARLRELIGIGKQMAFFRSYSIEVSNRAIYRQRSEMERIAESRGLTYLELVELTDLELRACMRGEAVPADFRNRDKRFGYVGIGDEIEAIYGSALDSELALHERKVERVSELRGTIACKGRVIGTVRLILEQSDIPKVGVGDIIVTAETLPDYIIAMQKAAAFVTNQGGITSHAALVAREMRKPCIIDTKIATQIFKDGDMVEVDADNGIVRKI